MCVHPGKPHKALADEEGPQARSPVRVPAPFTQHRVPERGDGLGDGHGREVDDVLLTEPGPGGRGQAPFPAPEEYRPGPDPGSDDLEAVTGQGVAEPGPTGAIEVGGREDVVEVFITC